MSIIGLRRLARNVVDVASTAGFYIRALGFQPSGVPYDNPQLAALLGLNRVCGRRLRLGAQEIELTQCDPPGALYPTEASAQALYFQHIAILSADIAADYARAMGQSAIPISRGGPQVLPARSGGVTAFKFRDPSGHPLELLEPSAARGTAAPVPGYDHAAISIGDLARSLAFYTGLDLILSARQVNHGPEQDRLDGLDHVTIDVIAMRPPHPAPHLELLHYRNKLPQKLPPPGFADIAADRLVFAATVDNPVMLRDPDGRIVILEPA
ncbi:MAG: VOC family protein [Acidocella sp.]|nr:VOC family protein [Acidocella sp.]